MHTTGAEIARSDATTAELHVDLPILGHCDNSSIISRLNDSITKNDFSTSDYTYIRLGTLRLVHIVSVLNLVDWLTKYPAPSGRKKFPVIPTSLLIFPPKKETNKAP